METLLPAYEAYAEGKNEELELMFHPGNLTAEYELLDARRKELAAFYMFKATKMGEVNNYEKEIDSSNYDGSSDDDNRDFRLRGKG